MKDWAAVARYFDRPVVVHLATLLPDGGPHSVPVWVSVDGDTLLFFTMAGSRKDRSVVADPRVAMSVTNPDDDLDSAFVRGRVVKRLVGPDAWPVIDRIAREYTGESYARDADYAAFVVQPETWWARDDRTA